MEIRRHFPGQPHGHETTLLRGVPTGKGCSPGISSLVCSSSMAHAGLGRIQTTICTCWQRRNSPMVIFVASRGPGLAPLRREKPMRRVACCRKKEHGRRWVYPATNRIPLDLNASPPTMRGACGSHGRRMPWVLVPVLERGEAVDAPCRFVEKLREAVSAG